MKRYKLSNKIFIEDENGCYIKATNGKIRKLKDKDFFDLYRKEVRLLTEQNKFSLENLNLRGFLDYHIDHKISIHFGYKNNISPIDIAHQTNLRLIKDTENMKKGIKCHIDSNNYWILLKYSLV